MGGASFGSAADINDCGVDLQQPMQGQMQHSKVCLRCPAAAAGTKPAASLSLTPTMPRPEPEEGFTEKSCLVVLSAAAHRSIASLLDRHDLADMYPW